MRNGRSEILAGAFLLAWPALALATWFFDFEASRNYDDNLPRAQRESDIKGGSSLTAGFSAGQFIAFDEFNSLTAAAEVKAARYDHYRGLDFVALGTTIGLRRKLGLGLFAPWLEASVSASREDYSTDLRDSNRYNLTLRAGKRVTERLEGSLGFAAERRDGRVSVYDLSGRNLFLRANYALTERARVTFGYNARSGDVVSSTRRNLAIFRASSAIAADPAFGPDYFAYRLYGNTRTPSIGLNWALSEFSSVNIVYERELTHADGGLNYASTIFSASFLYRY